MPAIELSRGGWTAALGGSLLMHLALAAAAVPFLGAAKERRAVTEITFSEPEIESLPAEPAPAPIPAMPPAGAEMLTPAPSSASLAQEGAVAGLPESRSSETAASPGGAERAVPGAAERVASAQPAAVAPTLATDASAAPVGSEALRSLFPPLLPAESAGSSLGASQGEPLSPVVSVAMQPSPLTAPMLPAVASVPQGSLSPASAPALTVEDIIAADAAAQSAARPAETPATLAGGGPSGALPAVAAAERIEAPAGDETIGLPVVAAGRVRFADSPWHVAPATSGAPLRGDTGAASALPAVAAAESAKASATDETIGAPAVVVGRVRPAVSPGRVVPAMAGAPLRGGVSSDGPPTLAQILAGSRYAVVPELPQRFAQAGNARLAPAPPRPLAPAGGGIRAAGGVTVLSSLGEDSAGGFGRGSAAWREAVGFVRGFGGDGCFAALPVEKGERVGLEAFGADRGEIERFAQASADGLARPTDVLRGNLAGIQCSALRLARSSKLYPDFALSITLQLPAGEFDAVTGEILGAGTRAVQLLLIDETGQVQTVARYATGPDGPLAFDFPFSREELADARGLFLAIASDKPLSNLDFDIKGMTAPTFFRLLDEESKAADAALDIAMVAFDLDGPPDAVSAQQ